MKTLDQLLQEINVVQDPLEQGASNRPGVRIEPRFITIHNTDNDGPGADARAHGRYMHSQDARNRQVSWHYTVDDRVVVQSLPTSELAWHAGTGAGNASSVGVEICMNQGIDEAAANGRAAKLAAWLGRVLGIAIPDGLRQHHDWSGKNCPSVIRRRANGWEQFKAAAKAAFDDVTTAPVAAPEMVMAVIAEAAGDAELPGRVLAEPVPGTSPVPFAASPTGPQQFWPILTSHAKATVVSCKTVGGPRLGSPERMFLAAREGGARFHVGVDLFASSGDEVVACEDGKIVAFHPFYPAPGTGEMLHALLIEHAGFVVNYGEVKANSLSAYGLAVDDRVTAGQKIGRVGGTAMIHFETYGRGTRQTAQWRPAGTRPGNLLNPTQYLLDLATHGVRLGPSGRAMATAPHGETTSVAAAEAPDGVPTPGSGDWDSPFGGREWRYDHRGIYTRDLGEGLQPWRTPGEPSTVRRIWSIAGPKILEHAARHEVNPALILMTIATETAFLVRSGFTGPMSFRWEAGVWNADVSPQFGGSYSAGPMQVLATTAREIVRQSGLAHDPLTVAPPIRSRPQPPPATHPLYDFATSLDIGCAVIRQRFGETGDNPILVSAMYNAGSLRPGSTDWGVDAFGDHLDRAAQWYGDACAVLSEEGIV